MIPKTTLLILAIVAPLMAFVLSLAFAIYHLPEVTSIILISMGVVKCFEATSSAVITLMKMINKKYPD